MSLQGTVKSVEEKGEDRGEDEDTETWPSREDGVLSRLKVRGRSPALLARSLRQREECVQVSHGI